VGARETAWPSKEDLRSLASPHWREEATDDLVSRGRQAISKRRFQDSLECFRESVDLIKKGSDLKHAHYNGSVRNGLNALGALHMMCGDLDKAEEHLVEAQAIQDAISSTGLGCDDFSDRAGIFNDRALLMIKQGEIEGAEKLLKQCLYMISRAYRPSNVAMATTLGNLGELYFVRGDLKTAVRHFEKALFQLKQTDSTYVDFLSNDVTATVMTSMAKCIRLGTDDSIGLGQSKTLLADAASLLESDDGFDFMYHASEAAAWHVQDGGNFIAAQQFYKQAFETSVTLVNNGLMSEIRVISENNYALFAGEVQDARALIASSVRELQGGNRARAGVEAVNGNSPLAHALHHNFNVIHELCNDSTREDGAGEKRGVFSEPQLEILRLPTGKEVHQIHHTNFICGMGIVLWARPSEFSI
jgi:tetratricopeptide (TPR) repeat protein